jgi:hypothetical protein
MQLRDYHASCQGMLDVLLERRSHEPPTHQPGVEFWEQQRSRRLPIATGFQSIRLLTLTSSNGRHEVPMRRLAHGSVLAQARRPRLLL